VFCVAPYSKDRRVLSEASPSLGVASPLALAQVGVAIRARRGIPIEHSVARDARMAGCAVSRDFGV
jgi:hypothetical protein